MTTKLFKKEKKFDIQEFLTNYSMYIVVAVMILFTGFTQDNFFTIGNMSNILANTSVRFIIALGVSGTLIIRGTDLSAGRIVGLSALISGTLVQKPDFVGKFFPGLMDMPLIVPLLIVIGVCAILGLLNGIIVAYLNVPPFLATLGTQIMIYGLNMLYSQNKPIGTFKDSYVQIGQGKIGNFLPYLTIIAIIIGILMWILYTKTKYGKNMYAIGGNEHAAEVSGVNVSQSKLKIFMLAGALYGLAGFLLSAKTGSVGPSAGQGYELEAIASATIGGVSTAGGQGSVPGILLGVFVFELLKVCLSYLGVSPDMTNVIQGLVIVIAVALDIRKTTRKK
ncbi:beta-methylgalactoside transporter [Erysipelothrix sp. HDW6C]|uniref:galactose/methyl galactoside ABC transporter permease MglC n=1 Tax=Erysipelothrix sp. HDW6C TaxID=2714930 RepID=UPI001409E658|nr:beta-methylgalactoside transporter [Erysipelothrix sp. HDW6C]QIK69688.1 beta-methylgalactoside transporter [Erysipelothrix sp. HDW6C]